MSGIRIIDPNYFKRLAILAKGILLFYLYSCASLTNRTQIISVDSSPRGADVYIENEDKKIGITPFFYQMPRAKNLALKFKIKGHLDPIEHREACSFRWLVAGLGNIPFFISNPITGFVALGYDFFSENAWHCNEKIRVDLGGEYANTCYRFFVVPPYHKSQFQSFRLYELWKQSVNNQIGECHSFVNDDELRKQHRMLNFGLHNRFDYKKVSDHKIKKVGVRTGANVFVTLNFDEKFSDILHADYFDMHKDVPIDKFPKVTKIPSVQKSQYFGDEITSFVFEIFPNSISYESRNSYHSEDTFAGNRQSKKTLPILLTSLNLLNITNPEAYETWDIAYGLYPSLRYYSFDWIYSLKKDRDIRWKLSYLMPAYEGRVTFFTALGQISMGLGWGPLIAYSKYSGGSTEVIPSSFTFIYSRYAAHLNKSFFIYSDNLIYYLDRKFSAINGIESKSFFEIAFGLGYFLSDLGPQSIF